MQTAANEDSSAASAGQFAKLPTDLLLHIVTLMADDDSRCCFAQLLFLLTSMQDEGKCGAGPCTRSATGEHHVALPLIGQACCLH